MKSKDGKVGFYIPSTFLSSKQLYLLFFAAKKRTVSDALLAA